MEEEVEEEVEEVEEVEEEVEEVEEVEEEVEEVEEEVEEVSVFVELPLWAAVLAAPETVCAFASAAQAASEKASRSASVSAESFFISYRFMVLAPFMQEAVGLACLFCSGVSIPKKS